jgi:hypothetical protein
MTGTVALGHKRNDNYPNRRLSPAECKSPQILLHFSRFSRSGVTALLFMAVRWKNQSRLRRARSAWHNRRMLVGVLAVFLDKSGVIGTNQDEGGSTTQFPGSLSIESCPGGFNLTATTQWPSPANQRPEALPTAGRFWAPGLRVFQLPGIPGLPGEELHGND